MFALGHAGQLERSGPAPCAPNGAPDRGDKESTIGGTGLRILGCVAFGYFVVQVLKQIRQGHWDIDDLKPATATRIGARNGEFVDWKFVPSLDDPWHRDVPDA